MLFRPSFCAHCGEKIERADWSLLTSRRFCQVCESEFKAQDMIPRVIVAIGVVVGIFGLGGYLKSGTPTDPLINRQPRRFVEQASPTIAANSGPRVTEADRSSVSGQPDPQRSSSTTNTQPGTPQTQLKAKQENTETIYFCGAATKKGTPCSRRVKGNVRCFQHTGMPAMLPAEKLRIG